MGVSRISRPCAQRVRNWLDALAPPRRSPSPTTRRIRAGCTVDRHIDDRRVAPCSSLAFRSDDGLSSPNARTPPAKCSRSPLLKDKLPFWPQARLHPYEYHATTAHHAILARRSRIPAGRTAGRTCSRLRQQRYRRQNHSEYQATTRRQALAELPIGAELHNRLPCRDVRRWRKAPCTAQRL